MHVVRDTLMATLALGLWMAPSPAQAELDAETALELARAQWFEGIPEDHLDRLSREAHRAIADLLDDPARRRAMGTASRVRAETEFSYDVLADRLRLAIDRMVPK